MSELSAIVFKIKQKCSDSNKVFEGSRNPSNATNLNPKKGISRFEKKSALSPINANMQSEAQGVSHFIFSFSNSTRTRDKYN